MKNKLFIKFVAFLLSFLLFIPTVSISATMDEEYVEEEYIEEEYTEGEYVEDDYEINCGAPALLIIIIILIAPLTLVFEITESIIAGDFSVILEIPNMFISTWTSIFG